MLSCALAAVASIVTLPRAHAQSSATVGTLRGVVHDRGTGEPAVGATIVATSPSLLGEQVAISEDGGQYFLTALPPGLYVLTVFYADTQFARANVLVQVGKEAVVNLNIDSLAKSGGKPRGEVIELTGTVPIVDQGSTKTGLTITEDYTRNVPTSRTFGGVVGQAAGAQSDNYGISFAGATSLENTYIVEGINTTDTGFGGLSVNLPNEFISETEVITGGYNAEFGRATGGIVNVVTKQGSDELHGSVFGYLQPGALIADAKVIQREGGSIDSKTDLDYRYDVGAELGGPIIKKKLWFHVGFNPSVSHETTTRLVQRQVDGTDGPQDGIPDVDPETGITKHEPVASRTIPGDFKQYYFTAKLSGAVDQNNQFQASVFGNPRAAVDLYRVTGNPDQTQRKYDDGAYTASAKWTSKLADGKTQIDAVAGYHRGFQRQRPYSASQNEPFLSYDFDRSLYDFSDLEGGQTIARCNDGAGDDYPLITNCPVFGYSEGGIDLLEDELKTRTSLALAVTQRVSFAGYHVLKAGFDGELTRFRDQTRYSGGVRWRRSADTLDGEPGRWQSDEYFRFVDGADPDGPLAPGQILCANGHAVCERSPGLDADTTSRNLAAFAQDSWQLRPNVTVQAGLRWEQQVGYVAEQLQGKTSPEGEAIPTRGYELDNLLSPRIGFVYDPTRDGKAKLFGHYGRFYENVPMDLSVRSFGGEIVGLRDVNLNRFTPTAGAYDPNCNVDHTAGMSGADLAGELDQCTDRGDPSLLGGGYEYVSKGLRGQRTDEIILGAEYELHPNFKVGANYIHRELPVVIEDISVDGGNTYLVTNPGFNFDDEAASLRAQAARLAAGTPEEQALAEVYEQRAASLAAVKRLEKPVRSYDAVQLTATQRPTKSSLLIASYTFSRSKGNYPGLFSTETGQNDPNITSLYDLPDLMANRYGPLGLDRPHNIKLDGFYLFDLAKAGHIVVGASFRGQSGIAHNVLGAHPTYGIGEAYLLPRGAAMRSPFTTQFDTRVAYGYHLSKSTQLEAFVTVFNLLDAQEQLNVDENYTFDSANPILGGTVDDLRHLKTIDPATGMEINATPTKNKNFGHTGSNTSQITALQQAPRTVQLGFRLTF